MNKKITVKDLAAKKKNGEKICAISLYDAPTARFAEECDIELILVGDSLGMTVLGYPNTVPVTIEQCLHHCSAVARGAKFAFLVGDMPFMTYHPSVETALINAARFLQEAGMDAVKIEGGAHMAETVRRLVTAGVPVMGHIGLLPQNILTQGGYKSAGKTEDEKKTLVEDAIALQEAGSFAIVLECIPAETAKEITEKLKIPTIGIGSGPYCDGQIQVINDLLGLFTDFIPKHAKRYANLSCEIRKALTQYSEDVHNAKFE